MRKHILGASFCARAMMLAAASVVAVVPLAFAQQTPSPAPSLVHPNSAQQGQSAMPATQNNPKTNASSSQAEAPKVDPKEDAAYKAFYDLPPGQYDDQIAQGEAFLAAYPQSAYREVVYSRLVQAYLSKQDFAKVEADGQSALALNPNDVDVLTTLGWEIPHSYDPNVPHAAARLESAEDYSKRALAILPTLTKPPAMTDADFENTRDERLSQAHSGLGLVYFRRGQYAPAVGEFEQSTKLSKNPDPIDFFVMGMSLEQLQRYPDAAAAYDQCGKVPNSFQPRCQAAAQQARKEAAAHPAPTIQKP